MVKPRTMAVFAAIVVLIVAACTPAASTAPTGPAATGPAATPRRDRRRSHQGAASRRRRRSGPAEGPDRLHRAGRGTRRRQAVQRQDSHVPDPVDRRRRRRTSRPRSPTSRRRPASTIQVDSIGSSHETVLKTRIDGGQPPDLAMLAQPTGRPRVRRGRQAHRRHHVHGRQEAQRRASGRRSAWSREGGKIWGIPYKADVKSTIWYPIKAFEAEGLHGSRRRGTS